MSWEGIGLVSQSRIPLTSIEQLYVSPPGVTPGADWNGTAASGFASTPTDPTRTTAKPVARLLTPPNQWFTDTLDVGVDCAANDSGTLGADQGIASVEFLYEGNAVEVTAPRWHTIQTERGPRTYFGWWVRLAKPAGTAGTAHLYIRVTANDGTMQQRVLGPYNFCPQDSLHDYTYTVSSQSEFQSAIADARSNSAQCPLFTIDTAGTYDLGTDVGTDSYGITGRYTLRASVAGVKIGRTSYTTDANARIGAQRTWWRFAGSNLTFDARYSAHLGAPVRPNDPQHWMDGITFTNSAPEGKNEMTRGLGPRLTSNRIVEGTPHYTECVFDDIFTQINYGQTARGLTFNEVCGDCMSNVLCAQLCTWQNHDSGYWNVDTNAFTVQYTGSETTATLSRSGGNVSSGANGGIFRCVIGATTYEFQVGNEESYYTTAEAGGYDPTTAGEGYWCADVVAWLNSLPDVTATLDPAFVTDDRAAAAISVAGIKGQGFGTGAANAANDTPRDIKAAPLQLVWNIDTHGDWYQHTSGRIENVIIRYCRAWQVETQVLFLAPILSGGVASTRDFAFIGNLHANKADPIDPLIPNGGSQFNRTQEFGHVLFVHNTFADTWLLVNDQQLTSEGYNLIANSSLEYFTWNVEPLEGFTIRNLRLHEGAAFFEGAESDDDVMRLGDETTLYTDYDAGDFTATALAKTVGFAPVTPEDYARTAYPAIAVPGGLAEAADALFVAPQPGDDLGTAGQALKTAMDGLSNSGMWWALDPLNGPRGSSQTVPVIAGGLPDLTQATSVAPTLDATAGLQFDSDKDQRIDCSATGTFTIMVLVRKNEADDSSGHIIDVSGLNYQPNTIGFGGVTVSVDGAAVANKGALLTALDDGAWHTVKWEGVSLSGTFRLGRASTSLWGDVLAAVALDESEAGASEETLVDSWFAEVTA